MWTAEHRATYMREYRAKHREWLRTLYALWYRKNRAERNRRRWKAKRKTVNARPYAGQAAGGACTVTVGRTFRPPDGAATQSGKPED